MINNKFIFLTQTNFSLIAANLPTELIQFHYFN